MRWLFALLYFALYMNVAAEPKTRVPHLQFSVPCLEVKEPPQGPPDFLSIFYELPLPQFPFKTDFEIANCWSYGLGKFQQEVKVLKPNRAVHLSSGKQTFELHSTSVPFMAINQFEGIVFERPGLYWIEVDLQGKPVLTYPLNVRLSTKAKAGVQPATSVCQGI